MAWTSTSTHGIFRLSDFFCFAFLLVFFQRMSTTPQWKTIGKVLRGCIVCDGPVACEGPPLAKLRRLLIIHMGSGLVAPHWSQWTRHQSLYCSVPWIQLEDFRSKPPTKMCFSSFSFQWQKSWKNSKNLFTDITKTLSGLFSNCIISATVPWQLLSIWHVQGLLWPSIQMTQPVHSASL